MWGLITMDQIKIDREKVIAKLKNEYNCDDKWAQLLADRLNMIHPDLVPLVEAWCQDEFLDYTFQTMSVSLFMELHEKNYITAITWMDHMIKNPDSVERFHGPFFTRR